MTMMKKLGEQPPPQQDLPLVRICWDELFAFLRSLFRPKRIRPKTILENLAAETTTSFKTVFLWEVPEGFEGGLEEISMYSSRPATTRWLLLISEQEQFNDKTIHTTLTLPYGDVTIHTGQKVILRARTTDGVATDIDGSLTGEERYLEV